MRKFAALGAIAALGLSGQAFADDISYNLIEGSYVNSEIGAADGDGFALAGAFEFHPNFHGFGSYSDVNLDGTGLTFFNAGLGLNWGLTPALDFVSGLSYERIKIEGAGSESGFGVNAGLRGRVADRLEFTGNIKYVDYGSDADDIVFSVGGRYYFTDALAAGVDFSKWDDLDLKSWNISLRYDFGRRN